MSCDDDDCVCRMVAEDSSKRSRRKAFLRSSISLASSSSVRVRLFRSMIWSRKALVRSCDRNCRSLARRDCSGWSGSSDCGWFNFCCSDLCKCSCRLNCCRCRDTRSAGMLSRKAAVMCWTFHASSILTSSASSSAMLGISVCGGGDVSAMSIGAAESLCSSSSRDRCDPCDGSLVVSCGVVRCGGLS